MRIATCVILTLIFGGHSFADEHTTVIRAGTLLAVPGDAIDKGYLPGPRIFAAGSSLAATGGHGDVDGVKAELLTLWTPETICDRRCAVGYRDRYRPADDRG